MAAPLSSLTRKTAPDRVLWTPQCEAAFQELKDKLTSQPVLRLPNHGQPFVLRTDASDVGLGAVLLQRDSAD
ncbi:ribonuclease H family protein, partial [Acinetobacter baumannii]|uniref:ribonuclease H family protein n=1 Tax=Acinetobacter baumannii TaxID=470 RepID=UPI003392ED6C